MSADYSTEKFEAMSRDELLAVVKRLIHECVPAVWYGTVHSGLEDAVKAFTGVLPRDSGRAELPEPPREDLPLCKSFVEEWMMKHSNEKQTGLREINYAPFSSETLEWIYNMTVNGPSTVLPIPECGMLATSPEAAAQMVGLCPDCKGTGVYRGILEKKPCPTCQNAVDSAQKSA